MTFVIYSFSPFNYYLLKILTLEAVFHNRVFRRRKNFFVENVMLKKIEALKK